LLSTRIFWGYSLIEEFYTYDKIMQLKITAAIFVAFHATDLYKRNVILESQINDWRIIR
jgi:hypothetical protein